MVRKNVKLSPVVNAFEAAQDFVLLFADVMEEVDSETGLSPAEIEEVKTSYRQEAMENIRSFLGLSLAAVAKKCGVALTSINTGDMPKEGRACMANMFHLLFFPCTMALSADEMVVLTGAVMCVDACYEDVSTMSNWDQHTFAVLLLHCGMCAEKLLGIGLPYDEELSGL